MLSTLIFVFVSLFLNATSYAKITYEWGIQNNLREEEEMFVESFNRAYERLTSEELGLKPGANVQAWLRDSFAKCRCRVLDSTECDKNETKVHKVYFVRAVGDGKILGFAFFKETENQGEMHLWISVGVSEGLVFSIGSLLPETRKIISIIHKTNGYARDFYVKQCGFTQCDNVYEGYSPELYVGYEWQGDIKKELEEINLKNLTSVAGTKH